MIQNKKGEIGAGYLIMVGVAVIVALVLFQSSAQQVGQALPSLVESGNVTITCPAVGGITEITGQELVGTPIVSNATNEEKVVAASNYTVYECVKTSNSLKGICFKAIGDKTKDPNMGAVVNISYSYYPAGYIDDSGGRAVTGIIVLLCAIGVALVAYLGVRLKQ